MWASFRVRPISGFVLPFAGCIRSLILPGAKLTLWPLAALTLTGGSGEYWFYVTQAERWP
jgi:hypothetical protein